MWEEGWPLGLQPLNVRVALPRTGEFSGSVSFNTLLTGSPTSSTDSSSDLDTEKHYSGSLIGVSNILELSRKSSRVRKVEVIKEKKSNKKPKTWLFSLCSRDTTDAQSVNNPPSLAHFLAVERRAANEYGRNQSPNIYGPDELSLAQSGTEPNSLFVNGQVAPPRVSPWHETDAERKEMEG
ncbi:hypothetical protein GH714_004517 [Hevea brasiliensis]|uniref:Uncharacterized protein n=1 Tax=Hevea brasiliensis TaxID=3981 RepID=A0A6A6NBG4_HEVBR|nr:hypothetical protein GH714_004517 [Hevea brasiliensis]